MLDFICEIQLLLLLRAEPAEWISAAQVQELKWLAETLGCFYELLSLLLQKL